MNFHEDTCLGFGECYRCDMDAKWYRQPEDYEGDKVPDECPRPLEHLVLSQKKDLAKTPD